MKKDLIKTLHLMTNKKGKKTNRRKICYMKKEKSRH